jgi:hypothetical protein
VEFHAAFGGGHHEDFAVFFRHLGPEVDSGEGYWVELEFQSRLVEEYSPLHRDARQIKFLGLSWGLQPAKKESDRLVMRGGRSSKWLETWS